MVNDRTIRRFPLAMMKVDTPFYTGEMETMYMYMKPPIYELILGCFSNTTIRANQPHLTMKRMTESMKQMDCRVMIVNKIRFIVLTPEEIFTGHMEETKDERRSRGSRRSGVYNVQYRQTNRC